MAVSSPTTLDTGGTNSSATHTSASVSASAGDLVIASIATHKFQPADKPSGVTYNGNAMTLAVDEWTSSAGSGKWNATAIYYYKATGSISGTVVVTCPNTMERISCAVFKVTGHDTTTPVGDTDTQQADNGGTQPSLTLTTTSGDFVIYVVASQDDPVVAGADLTSLLQDNSGWRDNHMWRAADAASENVTAATAFGDRGYSSCAAVISQAAAGGSSIAAIVHHYRQQGIM
jgi:hypothetical protein